MKFVFILFFFIISSFSESTRSVCARPRTAFERAAIGSASPSPRARVPVCTPGLREVGPPHVEHRGAHVLFPSPSDPPFSQSSAQVSRSS